MYNSFIFYESHKSNTINNCIFCQVILPYLTILSMQIKNVIIDNDYEFTLSSVAASFSSISSSSTSPMFTSSSSTLSSSSRDKEPQHSHQHHQQDVLKICVLLFDTYKKLCTPNIENKTISISRQSIQESLLPGLACLKEIFQNNVMTLSHNSPSSSNEFALQIEGIMSKVEQLQHQNSTQGNVSKIDAQSFSPLVTINNTMNNLSQITPKITPTELITASNTLSTPQTNNSVTPASISVQAASTVGDLVNAGVAVLTNTGNLTTPISTMANDNANFKSFFKGINNLKDHSKDKFSNFLLTNKTFKK